MSRNEVYVYNASRTSRKDMSFARVSLASGENLSSICQ